MTEEQFTLALFWVRWKRYQDRLAESLAPLTDEQLALRAAPHLRTVGEMAAHSIASRAWWLHDFLGEGGPELAPLAVWDEPDAPARSAAELLAGLDLTWAVISGCLSRWSNADMQSTFPIDWDDQRSDLSRSYVVWHLIQHDILHGGEISLTLGVNGMTVSYI